jgi:hypothetical protein
MEFKEKVLRQLKNTGTENFNNELAPFNKNLDTAKKEETEIG